MQFETQGARTSTEFAHFDAEARAWMSRDLPAIRSRLLQTGLPQDCEWHPNGFAVAKVDWETPFSTVRVHVWPSALRVVFPAHPPVHSHDRHITSFVLGGQYEDVLYRVEPAIASDSKAVQRYDVRKPPARGAVSGDTLVASDEFVCVSELERRLVPAHAWHAIPAGVAHETLMTTGQFCVTLAVKGAPLGHGWEFVVDQPGLPERLISRRQLTDQERMEVWKEVVPHLESVLEDSSFD